MDEFSNERQGLLEQMVASVRLPINGMTCQSCVRNIENNIKTKPGIITIKVNLQEKAGYIDYDPHIIEPKQIANEINDMGFISTYIAVNDEYDDEQIAAKVVINSNNKTMLTAQISIDGMSCQSCVKNIEGNISKQLGIQKISVNLEEKLATVEYESDICNATEIAEMISDMGFNASVFGQNEQPLKTNTYIERNGKLFKKKMF